MRRWSRLIRDLRIALFGRRMPGTTVRAKSARPPPPDPATSIAAQANLEMARIQERLGQQQIDLQRRQQDFAEKEYENQRKELERIRPQVDKLVQGQIDAGQLAIDQAKQAREDYVKTYQPIEQQLAAEAAAAGGAGEQEAAAGRASVDAQRAADIQRGASERQMASMGVNPNSGRFQGMNRSQEILSAASRAGAATGAREAEKSRGTMLRSNVAGIGRGVAGMGLQGAATGAGISSGAARDSAQNFNLAGQNAAAMMGAYGSGSNMLGQAASNFSAAGNTYNNAAQLAERNRQQTYAMQAADANNFNQGLSTAAMAAMFAFSDERLKDKTGDVDDEESLKSIEGRRIDKWAYKGDDRERIGTYAQDIEKTGGKTVNVGGYKAIDLISEIGVTQSAVKALAKKIRHMEGAAA